MTETERPCDLRYRCERARLPADLRPRFVELARDDASRAFMDSLPAARHGRVGTRVNHALRRFGSDFDVNGALGMYRMHLLSTGQWRALLGPAPMATWLDVGAGSGDVTATLAPLAGSVHTTELSRAMAWRLRQRGFPCTRVDVATEGTPVVNQDLVTCLNVLDRCARPRSLLEALRRALAPGGRLVLALVLPYDPFYYAGAKTPDPLERLACTSKIWEIATGELLALELPRFGLEVDVFTRAPYISTGDSARSHYTLDALVAVCRAAPERVPSSG